MLPLSNTLVRSIVSSTNRSIRQASDCTGHLVTSKSRFVLVTGTLQYRRNAESSESQLSRGVALEARSGFAEKDCPRLHENKNDAGELGGRLRGYLG